MKPTRAVNVTGRADWRYRKSCETDVAATIRAAIARQKEAVAHPVNVRAINKKAKS